MMSPKQQAIFDDVCRIWQENRDMTQSSLKMRKYLIERCGHNYRSQRLLVTLDQSQFAERIQGVFNFWDQEIVIYTHQEKISFTGMVYREGETYRVKFFSEELLCSLELSHTQNHGDEIAGVLAMYDNVPLGFGGNGCTYLDNLGFERIKKFLDQSLAV